MNKISQEEKQIHIQRWQESGKTKKSYSDHTGINYRAFKRWCEQFGYVNKRGQHPQAGFVELKTMPLTPPENLEIIYPNGVRIQLTTTNNKELLRTLINL